MSYLTVLLIGACVGYLGCCYFDEIVSWVKGKYEGWRK